LLDNGDGTYDILVDRFGGEGAGQFRTDSSNSIGKIATTGSLNDELAANFASADRDERFRRAQEMVAAQGDSYVYVCKCICMCGFVYVHIYMYVCICIVYIYSEHRLRRAEGMVAAQGDSYMYLCICICIYINTYMCTYMCIHVHIYMYTYMYICIYLRNCFFSM